MDKLLDLIPGVAQIKLILAGAAIAALGLLLWSWHDRGERNDALTAALADEKAATQIAVAAVRKNAAEIQRQAGLRAADQIEMRYLDAEKRRAQDDKAAMDAVLNNWRGKLNAQILKRPDVFGRAASLATSRRLRDIEQITRGNEAGSDREAGTDAHSNPAGPGPNPRP